MNFEATKRLVQQKLESGGMDAARRMIQQREKRNCFLGMVFLIVMMGILILGVAANTARVTAILHNKAAVRNGVAEFVDPDDETGKIRYIKSEGTKGAKR